MRKLALLTTLLCLAVAIPIASATKMIVGKSIAGIQLGVSQNDVTAKLGQPSKIVNLGSKNNVAGQPQKRLDYGTTDVTITGGVVTEIETTSKAEKTSNGVRVGISETTLKKKVSGLKCNGKGSKRFCTKGSFAPGKPIMTFDISSKKKVKRVSLATVID